MGRLELATIGTTWAVMVSFFLLTVHATVVALRCGREEAAYGLWVTAAVLLSPISWIHHMVLLLIPLAQLLDCCAKSIAVRLGIYGFGLAEVGLGLFWLHEAHMSSSSWLTFIYPAVFLLSLLVTFASAYMNSIDPVSEGIPAKAF
jgi:hypothetical protein